MWSLAAAAAFRIFLETPIHRLHDTPNSVVKNENIGPYLELQNLLVLLENSAIYRLTSPLGVINAKM